MSFEQVKARHRLAWGLDVESYVRFTAGEFTPICEKMIEMADPPWAGSVLDLGCGPGTASFPAARRVGPGGRVVGVDLAAPMVAWAERAAEKEGLTNARFIVGDAEDLGELEEASFDVAISNFGVIFAPEPTRVFDGIVRLLKPGGVFVMSIWKNEGLVGETFDFMRKLAPPPPEGAVTMETWAQPGRAEDILSTRFDQVTRTDVSVMSDYATIDLAWQRMRDARPPFALLYGKMPMDQKMEVEREAKDMFRRYVSPDGHVRADRAAAILRGVRRG